MVDAAEASGYATRQSPMASRSQASERAFDLLDIVRVSVAVGLLLVGQVDPEPRLVVGGVALNTLMFALATLLVSMLPGGARTLAALIFVLMPLHLFGATAAWSPDAAYGVWKYGNLVISVVLAVALVHPILRDKSTVVFAQLWVGFSLVLLALAVVTKLDGGFFNRDVRFYVNGPIVFARIMGVALFLSLIAFTGGRRLALAALFSLAIVWTASKGPILFAAVCLLIFFARALRRPVTTVAVVGVLGVVVVSIFAPVPDQLEGSFARLIETYDYVFEGGPVPGSISSRLGMVGVSLEAIRDRLFGIGAGGWAYLTVNPQPWPYPHNLFLEIFSEAGLAMGALVILPFVMFLRRPRSPFFLVALFLLLCQQTSGDLLDARYLLFFSIIATVTRFGAVGAYAAARARTAP